jgi:tRNA1(Val) A37 N6-methylase TrmN6
MQDRVGFVEGDVFAPPPALKRSFDLVFANPPFHGEGNPAPDPARARALMDQGQLGAWLKLGMKRTVSGGVFTVIVSTARVGEALAVLPATGVTLFPLWPRQGVGAKRTILRVVKASGAAFVLHPGLVLHGPDGTYSPQAEGILRRGEALALDFAHL